MVLVRPDAHVGLVARAGDLDALDRYLGKFLLRDARPVRRLPIVGGASAAGKG